LIVYVCIIPSVGDINIMSKMFMSLILLCSFGTVTARATEQSSDQQFKAKEDQALAAERRHDLNESHRWNELALSEMAAGLTSKGLEHERHAMQLYSSKDVANNFGVLGYLGSRVILTLTNQGHSAEAEKLLVDAVERTKAVAGPKSVATQAQIGDLFSFYLHQENYHAALRTLAQVLDFDLSNGETPSQSLTHFINVNCRYQPKSSVVVLHVILEAIRGVEKTKPLFAITAVEKVVKAQEARLTADDERLVETLGALGDAYFQAKKYEEAEGYYSRAYEITKQYHPESAFAVHQCGQNFLANLKEVGRSMEADRLSKLKWEGMQNLKPQPFPLSEPPQNLDPQPKL
jgi:tetratricopeptide (TPR) repeat protein